MVLLKLLEQMVEVGDKVDFLIVQRQVGQVRQVEMVLLLHRGVTVHLVQQIVLKFTYRLVETADGLI
jgi:hypothetical protein